MSNNNNNNNHKETDPLLAAIASSDLEAGTMDNDDVTDDDCGKW